MSFCCPHMPSKTGFLMTIHDFVYYNARVTRVWYFFLLQMNWGLHNPTFQAFKHFSLGYSDSSVIVARLIYSFIVCRYHVKVTSSSVFYVYYYCLLESKNNVSTFHMKIFLSSLFCLIDRSCQLACLITSPVGDSNVFINDVKNE